jgi:glutaminyl-peptide cyclotransferase
LIIALLIRSCVFPFRHVGKVLKGITAVSLFLIYALSFFSCDTTKSTDGQSADSLHLNYVVLKTIPHDTKAFTEGLVIHNNKLLESTGLNSQSWIAEVNSLSGDHDKKVTLPEQYFGEGITVLNGKIYQLTYREKIGFVYDADTYEKVGEFQYSTEGWGLTHDGHHLIMSDGTNKLYYLDTTDLKVARTLLVTDPSGAKVRNLNELEFIDGFLFANVHETSTIVKIDPANGRIAGRLDLYALVDETRRMYPDASELNGIAFDPNANTLLVTGKFWPKAYVIRIN